MLNGSASTARPRSYGGTPPQMVSRVLKPNPDTDAAPFRIDLAGFRVMSLRVTLALNISFQTE